LFSWSDDLGKGFDPGVFGRFDLAALAQPHLKFLFVCLFYDASLSLFAMLRLLHVLPAPGLG
jgi:hypothetical protein